VSTVPSAGVDSDSIDDYLASGPIVKTGPWPVPGGAHADKLLVTFSDGSKAMAKVGSDDHLLAMSRHEVAARKLALELGYEDLVTPTAMRVIARVDGAPVHASLHLEVVGFDWIPAPATFDDADTLRAGLLDYLVDQSDRHNNNYVGVKRANGGSDLILVDHGFAFGYQGRPLGSPFADLHRGQVLDDETVERVRLLGTMPTLNKLGPFLHSGALVPLKARIDAVVANGCF
jgi:hypothetical protein